MMRFFVSPDRLTAVWRHHLEAPAGWTDCTDMDDVQFLEFMTR